MRIGVDKTTVYNWEAGIAAPNLRAIPGVVRFLGYDPRQGPGIADLGRQIRHLRQGQGLSMDALADLLGVDPSTVRGWERRGHRPGPRFHARLVDVLGLAMDSSDAGASFGERLRAARLTRSGLTQRELADQVGAGQQVVSDWVLAKRTPGSRERQTVTGALS